MNQGKMNSSASDTAQELALNIRRASDRARGSELKLQGEVDGLLRAALNAFGVDYDPEVNKRLRVSMYTSKGRPDSLFGHVVLDYKSPGLLAKLVPLRKAKSQVAKDYLRPVCSLAGVFDPIEAQKWVGILMDGRQITFATFDGLDGWAWSPVRDISRYTAATLIQYYRACYRKPLDPRLLSLDFGRETAVAVECISVLARHLLKPSARTNMLFKEWKRMFEQVSTYELEQIPSLASWAQQHNLPCRNDPSLVLFCLHTYYALVVKLLAAQLVTTSRRFGTVSFLDRLANSSGRQAFRGELDILESGKVFRDLGITNFLEGDFFLWYLDHLDTALETALRKIIEVFLNYEPATPRLSPNRCKDLLKVFYSSVIDEELRHDLGEYYTPDWLADLVLDRVGYTGDPNAHLLDPACGSGTFLVQAIQRLITTSQRSGLAPAQIVERAIRQIKGFDLNPLAVISSRTNYLLAISDQLGHDATPIEIPVYLCDCINVPEERTLQDVPCLVYTLETELGEFEIALPRVLMSGAGIAAVLHEAELCVEDHESATFFIDRLRHTKEVGPLIGAAEEHLLRAFFKLISYFEEKDWDQIWCSIVKNHFSSRNISEVDFIVGNPPWLRWSRLPVSYRRRCKAFCDHYQLVSGRGYAGGIESDISTVVTYSAIDNWLRPGGKLGFLITATVYKSDSATGFRKFRLPDGTRILPSSIDDLVALQPFPDASNETSMIVAKKARHTNSGAATYPLSGIPTTVWSKKPLADAIQPWMSLEEVASLTTRTHLFAEPVAEDGSPIFFGTKTELQSIRPFRGRSPYLPFAHKGTTTDKSVVYWVKALGFDENRGLVKIRNLTIDELGSAEREGVALTEGKWVEAALLYPLMRGRDLGRYCASPEGWHILVPNGHYENVESESEFKAKHPEAYRYLHPNADVLKKRASYRRYQRHLPFYVIFDVGDYTFAKHKVVWMEQQNPKEFRACVISQDAQAIGQNRMIVPDHKLYMLSLNNMREAHFICGVLNSHHIRLMLGGFLAGKQIGTAIFRYVGIMEFDSSNPRHNEISEISIRAHHARVGSRTTDDLIPQMQRRLDNLVRSLFMK